MKSVTNNNKTTKDGILHALKQTPQISIEELATLVDVSPITVRHHLNSLQAEGLVQLESVRRKVGRPYYIYSLTEQGHELFPHRYFSLTNRILDELKTKLPEELVNQIFVGVVKSLIEEHKETFETLTFEDRLNYVTRLLADEGFLARWEKTDDGYKIIEYSCPYISVGQKHAEICTFDKELMLTVLDTPIEQHSCMLQGDDCCQFTVTQNHTISLNSVQAS